MHQWFSYIAVAHSLLYEGSIIIRADNPILSLRRSHITLLVSIHSQCSETKGARQLPVNRPNRTQAAALVFLIIPVTLHLIIQHYSQVAIKIHYLLAITAIAALLYHTQDQRSNYRSYLVGVGVLWVVLSVACGVHTIIKKHCGYAWPTMTLQPFHKLLP